MRIINSFQPRGRFLRFCKKENAWHEVSQEEAFRKVKQSIDDAGKKRVKVDRHIPQAAQQKPHISPTVKQKK